MTLSNLRWSLAVSLAGLLAAGAVAAQSRRRNAATPGDFSYYMLVLSYAPDFCDQPGGNKSANECGTGRHVGFVVHGLWPQGDTTRGPENCGSSSPVSQSIVQAMLNYFPTASLIQHEWTTHGTCSGLSSADYFGAVKKARDSVTIPSDLSQPTQRLTLSPADIEAKVAAANASFPKAAFRTSCYKNGELEEVRICLTTGIAPRVCGSSAGECTTPGLTLLPVR
jgi:ribonuclease T2